MKNLTNNQLKILRECYIFLANYSGQELISFDQIAESIGCSKNSLMQYVCTPEFSVVREKKETINKLVTKKKKELYRLGVKLRQDIRDEKIKRHKELDELLIPLRAQIKISNKEQAIKKKEKARLEANRKKRNLKDDYRRRTSEEILKERKKRAKFKFYHGEDIDGQLYFNNGFINQSGGVGCGQDVVRLYKGKWRRGKVTKEDLKLAEKIVENADFNLYCEYIDKVIQDSEKHFNELDETIRIRILNQ